MQLRDLCSQPKAPHRAVLQLSSPGTRTPSVLTWRNQSPTAWLCAVSTGLGMSSHALCQVPFLCSVLPRGCHNSSTEPRALVWGLSVRLNPLPSSVFFLLHPPFTHPFGFERSTHAAVQVGCGPAGECSSWGPPAAPDEWLCHFPGGKETLINSCTCLSAKVTA